MTESDPPPLPLEIERLIFEQALKNRIQDATNLFLIARHTRDWLLPKAFEVVIIFEDRHFPTRFTPEKLHKYGKYVRHICIAERFLPKIESPTSALSPSHKDGIVSYCVAACPNLQTLAVWWGAIHTNLDADLLSQLPLTCMSIDPARLLEKLSKTLPGPVISSPSQPQSQPRPVFSNITHLEILNEHFILTEPDRRRALTYHFPNLTHIAVFKRNDKLEGIDFVLNFNHFPRLKALILWSSGPIGLDDYGVKQLPTEVTSDERVVVISCLRVKDWERGVREKGFDMWSFADKVLEERRVSRWKEKETVDEDC